MRRIINRLLSAVPPVTIAIASLYSAADPATAKQTFQTISQTLANDSRLIWVIAILIALYAVTWWLTSIDPPPRRRKTVLGLQPHYEATANQIRAVTAAKTDSDAEAIFAWMEKEQQATYDWIDANLGPAAREKFGSRSLSSSSFQWMWEGDHNQETLTRRSNALNALGDRLNNLEQLLESDRWDKKATSLWQRLSEKR